MTTLHGLARGLAVLEAHMETRQAEYKTEIGQLREDMVTRMEAMVAENAKRETRMLLALIVVVGVATTILSLVISAPF